MPGVYVFAWGRHRPAGPHRLERRGRNRNLGAQARALCPRGASRDLGGSWRPDRPHRWLAVAGIGGIADRACLSGSRSGRGDGRAHLCRPGDNAVPLVRRFNTRFFLGDKRDVFGEPMASEELEDVGWHRVGRESLASFRDVTRFMLTRAIALREGTASGEAPALLLGKKRSPDRRLPQSRRYNLVRKSNAWCRRLGRSRSHSCRQGCRLIPSLADGKRNLATSPVSGSPAPKSAGPVTST